MKKTTTEDRMPADAASSTSPGVIVFILLATATVLYAWWLSIKWSRERKDLILWLQEHRPVAWSGIPPSLRFHPAGGIDYLRHHELSEDPEFNGRCQVIGRYRLVQIIMLLIAAIDIGMVIVGTRYLGWVW
jgi:hypothetical protein